MSKEQIYDKGRLAPGDVVFVSEGDYCRQFELAQFRESGLPKAYLSGSKRCGTNTNVCLAGVDHINKLLTEKGTLRCDYNVLINSGDPRHDWRRLQVFQQWTLDGVIVANDGDGSIYSAGDTAFNVAVQGRAVVNNGYCYDTNNGIVGHTGSKTYTHKPEQMFDRNIMCANKLYVGILCKIVQKNTEYAKKLYDENPNMYKGCAVDLRALNIYTFKLVLFTDRQIHDIYNTKIKKRNRSEAYKEHHNKTPFGDINDKDSSLLGITREEVKYMIGAWKIGTVMDTSVERKMYFNQVPPQRGFRVMANVCVEFMGLQNLRNVLNQPEVGVQVPEHSSKRMPLLYWPTRYYNSDENMKRMNSTHYDYELKYRYILRRYKGKGTISRENGPITKDVYKEMYKNIKDEKDIKYKMYLYTKGVTTEEKDNALSSDSEEEEDVLEEEEDSGDEWSSDSEEEEDVPELEPIDSSLIASKIKKKKNKGSDLSNQSKVAVSAPLAIDDDFALPIPAHEVAKKSTAAKKGSSKAVASEASSKATYPAFTIEDDDLVLVGAEKSATEKTKRNTTSKKSKTSSSMAVSSEASNKAIYPAFTIGDDDLDLVGGEKSVNAPPPRPEETTKKSTDTVSKKSKTSSGKAVATSTPASEAASSSSEAANKAIYPAFTIGDDDLANIFK